MSTIEPFIDPQSLSAVDLANRHRRVLHVVNGEHYAGAERVQDLLGLHLPDAGYDCGFACVKPLQFPDARLCQDSPLWHGAMRHPFDYKSARRLAELAANASFDLIHSHTPRSAWAASTASCLSGLPWVHTQHDVSFEIPKSFVRRLLDRITITRLRRADAVIGVSPAATRLADQLRLGNHRQLVLNGVPSAGPLRRAAHQ